ncbi:hypothetical protein OS242_01905 [Tumebacillus sp. DT12]|uniref:Restriction endonuclease n=1 Tax=Tumebacillus lacus TaxID=2995335 RepID=A0ABT3WVM8_9BACL|nr:hypothetical protein [Tumebacillus lacus]MCX7568724.1 hypothetical protein [Tumebacillus lacus]
MTGGQKKNKQYDYRFTSVYEILREVYSEGAEGAFNKLIGTIASFMEVEDICFGLTKTRDEMAWDRKEVLERCTDNGFSNYITPFLTDDFKKFENCIRVLGFDLEILPQNIIVRPAINGVFQRSKDVSLLEIWLERNYRNSAVNYREALSSVLEGNPIACITACRNMLTGVYEQHIQPPNQHWHNGLFHILPEELVGTDTYSSILNAVQQSKKQGLQAGYKRFNVVYSLYSLLSHLGAHQAECIPMLKEKQVSNEDALLCLRMTEDVLIYTMNLLGKNT